MNCFTEITGDIEDGKYNETATDYEKSLEKEL